VSGRPVEVSDEAALGFGVDRPLGPHLLAGPAAAMSRIVATVISSA
jgi:hypothetical protein